MTTEPMSDERISGCKELADYLRGNLVNAVPVECIDELLAEVHRLKALVNVQRQITNSDIPPVSVPVVDGQGVGE